MSADHTPGSLVKGTANQTVAFTDISIYSSAIDWYREDGPGLVLQRRLGLENDGASGWWLLVLVKGRIAWVYERYVIAV